MSEIVKICRLSQLESLELYDYTFPILPNEISNLKKLESLEITCNTHDFEDVADFTEPVMSGSELTKICQLENLDSLVIDRIILTSLPEELVRLKNSRH